MIRFAVFDESGPAKEFTPRNAYLIGKEDLTVPGSIAFREGVLHCSRHNADAASLALQVDLGDLGLLTLQTCLLPDRVEPYLLDVELARHRIMLILNKLEEWSLSDLSPDHPVMTGLDEARALFTRALIAPRGTGNDAERSRLARQALSLGIRVGERMTMLQAERELTMKFSPAPSPRDDGRPSPGEARGVHVGCIVSGAQFAEPLQRIVQQSFGFVSCPLRWNELEVEEGRHTFAQYDRWIEWAVRSAKLPVVGGPVIDFSQRALPKWIFIWEHDYKTLRELAYEHLKTVVTRYRRAVTRWSPVAGLNANGAFSLRIEEMIDLTRLSVLTVRKLHPSAKVIVEITHPYGEHGTHNDRSISPILYAGLVKEAGIQVDGFGLRLQIGDAEPGRSSRDLMELSAILDTFAQFDKPIHVTAVGAPSQQLPTPPVVEQRDPGSISAGFNPCPGRWHGPWNTANQAEWMTSALTLAAAKPYVESVAWQALFDTTDRPEMPFGGLITADGRAKPSLKRMKEITAAFKASSCPSGLTSSVEGAPEPASTGAGS